MQAYIYKIFIISIGSARSPDGRFSPIQSSHLHGQTHPLSIHQGSSHLHQSSVSGENANSTRPGFSIQNSFMPPSSLSGAIPPVRPLAMLSEEGRSARLSPTSDISSKTLLERSLKTMNSTSISTNSKMDTKRKCLETEIYLQNYFRF